MAKPESIMVGHNEERGAMLHHLITGSRELKVVSIVGMGGIGKTTFAASIYEDPVIVSHFDTRAMVTVSQECNVRRILLDLLSSTVSMPQESFRNESDGQLAHRLQKSLKGRRYLILVDDIWSTEAWDDIKQCFPDDANTSRILLTTRNTEVAEYAKESEPPPHHMRLLNLNESLNLFNRKIFAKESFSSEFLKIGEEVVKQCEGLPLTIVVVAGLLSRNHTLAEWEKVANDVNSLVYENRDQQCSSVISLSYQYLPIHLKACFMYFGVFQEDFEINVKRLFKLWVAEGFLKVERDKSLEEVAEKCLQDLTDRSLVLTHKWGTREGKMKTCKLHDLIHGFCLREAQKQNFLCVTQQEDAQNFHRKAHQRLSISSCDNYKVYFDDDTYNEALSVLFVGKTDYYLRFNLEYSRFKLLRVLDIAAEVLRSPRDLLGLLHLRYLAFLYNGSGGPLDISLCNLQTYIVDYRACGMIHFSEDLWKMAELRHLRFSLNDLPNPPCVSTDGEKCLVLENLQSFSGMNPRNCTKEVFKRIHNVKKLRIQGHRVDYEECNMPTCFNDLCDLEKLESLSFHLTGTFDPLRLPRYDRFPDTLKKLEFRSTYIPWENMDIVGKLPNLEVLKLRYNACKGEKWEQSEIGFSKLRFLLLSSSDPRDWIATSDHFPLLEKLVLKDCYRLKEIPLDFGESLTLQLIEIENCELSVLTSAKQIQEDQQSYGVDVLDVRSYNIRGC